MLENVYMPMKMVPLVEHCGFYRSAQSANAALGLQQYAALQARAAVQSGAQAISNQPNKIPVRPAPLTRYASHIDTDELVWLRRRVAATLWTPFGYVSMSGE